MQKHIRFLAPAAMAMLLGLAGCKTMPGDRAQGEDADKAATAQQAPQAADPGSAAAAATAVPVEFFIAQLEPGTGLVEVKLADGSLYVEQMPVLTRNDLAEAAAMVDAQGQHFVGLRFNDTGARKLAEVSTKNVGKVMVLAVNRQMAAAPRIAEPLDRGVLAFRVPSAQDARDIATAIRGEPAPDADAAGAGAGADADAASQAPQQPQQPQ